jgi:hypothetical protein
MSVSLGRIVLDPPVFLAPMAGITDVPFRNLAVGLGAGLVVSEMVASGEVLRGRPEARARAELGLGDRRTAVQLAGREPQAMAEAAGALGGGAGGPDHRPEPRLPGEEGDKRAFGFGADARARLGAQADGGGGRRGGGAGDGQDAARLG